MGISPVMVVDMTNASPQVHRLISGTTLESVTLGGPYTGGAAEPFAPSSDQRQARSRVVEFNNDLYLTQGPTIRRFNTGTTDWDVVHTPTNVITTNTQFRSGWVTASVNGVLTLFLFYKRNAANFLDVLYTTDGTSWTQGTATAWSVSPVGHVIYWRGEFYVAGADDEIKAYNPLSDTWSAVTSLFAGSVIGGPSQWLPFNGNLLLFSCIGAPSGQPGRVFYRTGAGMTEVAGLTNLNAFSVAGYSGGGAFFEYQGNLYILAIEYISFANANNGIRCMQLVPGAGLTFTENELTSTVIPAHYRPGGGAGAAQDVTINSQIYLYVDEDATPGTPQIFFWIFESDVATTGSFWEWQGPGTLMTNGDGVTPAPGVSPGIQYARPLSVRGDGSFSHTVGDNSIEVFNPQSFSDRIDIDFRVGGTGATKSVRFYYNLGEGLPLSVATLTGTPSVVSGPSPAPGRTGNVLTTVTPDDMATVYRCSWDAPTDGLTQGAFYSLKAELF